MRLHLISKILYYLCGLHLCNCHWPEVLLKYIFVRSRSRFDTITLGWCPRPMYLPVDTKANEVVVLIGSQQTVNNSNHCRVIAGRLIELHQ